MLRKQSIKACLLLAFLLLGFSLKSQYKVTGGSGVPLLAKDDTNNRLQVYLLNGMKQVELRYTSTSNEPHKWFRYKQSALQPAPVASIQQGNVSVVTDVEEGYGYFAEVPGELARYVWIIDYSLYPVEFKSLDVSNQPDPCSYFKLSGDISVPKLIYYLPSNGIPVELKRKFEVNYTTLVWSDATKLFSQQKITEEIEGSPTEKHLTKVPLCDTEVELNGDLFARQFNMEKKIRSGTYQAVAVEAHATAEKMNSDADNVVDKKEETELGGSAPVQIHFKGIANDPVAALYIWKIYRKKDGSVEPLVRFTGEELDYTFDKFGDYTAELEVSDRSGCCVDSSNTFDISITESSLKIPNAFSPGTSPGLNDEFRVAYKSIVRFEGWIYNRWGVEMFHWSDPSKGWDGKKGGSYVSPGVYFYVIEAEGADGVKYKRKGDINILRSKNVQNE